MMCLEVARGLVLCLDFGFVAEDARGEDSSQRHVAQMHYQGSACMQQL
jgi:hypothetical protein